MPPRSPLAPLDRHVQYLKGVGPRRAESLARVGVHSARDLLYHTPRRYEDASTVARIASLEVGMDATVIGEVTSKGVLPTRVGLRVFHVLLRDGSGQIECSWPGQPFLDRTIQKGDLLLVTGPVKFFHGRQLQPREFVVLGRAGEDAAAAGKVLPIYPATEGLSQRQFRRILEENLDTLLAEAAEEEELFGAGWLERAEVPPLREALELLHRPPTLAAAERGRLRLAYEELFILQLLHARSRQRQAAAHPGVAFRRSDALIGALYRRLPFQLTGKQVEVIGEILDDMAAPRRMNRLVQGDVGSGKTVVALFAMLLAAENGYQAALMVPTEILAEQHARTLGKLLEGMPVEVALLTGRLGAGERRAALERIGSGAARIVVGTHALFQGEVAFERLGLVVIDEQHRFGVKQRLALTEMGAAPDLLVMSATPIPRSLALTLHGDLDISILDELPPGRRRIRTGLRPVGARAQIYEFIRGELEKGRQAFVVYPLVEESEKVELRAATAEYERLAAEVFPNFRLGLIHGQLPGEEKDAVMRAFLAGELDLLVSTTVIEVGIDVPNATVMVIEHAERFGLSQLHQLRGRVGRGGEESYCILVAAGGDEAIERLRLFAATDDGFEIARADLRLRGMGDLFGARQHGLPPFRFFDPLRDDALHARARADARAVVERDPELGMNEHQPFRRALESRYAERTKLFEVG
jgi:ATP-dependent DNA helicase RecG